MRRNCGACFNTSPGMGKGRQSHPRPLIAASRCATDGCNGKAEWNSRPGMAAQLQLLD